VLLHVGSSGLVMRGQRVKRGSEITSWRMDVGHSRKRLGRDGKPRYTAYYEDLRGIRHSAGTFATRRAADRAWQRSEARVAEGRANDPRRGRQTFERYVEGVWLPNHIMEITTREGYEYSIKKHILPWFGRMKMIDLLPNHVREWIKYLQNDASVGAKTIANLKNILSAILTTALNDQVVYIHAVKGVSAPTVPTRPMTIITPEQFDVLYDNLPDSNSKLLVETEIETGLRWGELTELRPKDFDQTARLLTISRTVVQVDPKFHPEGERFFVKEYPKDKEWRRMKVSRQLADKVAAHIKSERLGDGDLLFSLHLEEPAAPTPRAVPDPDQLGLTEPNDKGRQYKHGTLSGYNAGNCRCRACTDVITIYRTSRRANGKDSPRKPRHRLVDSDGHIPRDWFRVQVWKPACSTAKLSLKVTVRDLRHAHASWLLAGGADLQVVKERLGHARISTTEKYLHTLPDADESAVDAFNAIRRRRSAGSA
jgi:integrase